MLNQQFQHGDAAGINRRSKCIRVGGICPAIEKKFGDWYIAREDRRSQRSFAGAVGAADWARVRPVVLHLRRTIEIRVAFQGYLNPTDTLAINRGFECFVLYMASG